MIRMTRLTDYGIVLLTSIAQKEANAVLASRDLAQGLGLPLPTVNKILKTLTRGGLLTSHRGAKGGYSLARRPEEITVLDVINVTEGPVAIAECTVEEPGNCEHEGSCVVGGAWHRINEAIREALRRISLADMARPVPPGAGVVPLRGYGEAARC